MNIIFDFDGVIINSDAFHRNAYAESFRQLGIGFTEADYRKYFDGVKGQAGVENYLKSTGSWNPDLFNRIRELKRTFDSRFADTVTIYEDAIKLLRNLHGDGHTICITTGARRNLVHQILEKFGLNDSFDRNHIITAEDYGNSKPSPESYHTTMERLGFPPYESVVVIEDSPNGIAAAHAAGLTCIAVTHTHTRDQLSAADRIVDNLSEIQLPYSPEGNRNGIEGK